MASAAASVAHHPMVVPHVPRIRPPRMLKGTVSPNTSPQPPGPVPENYVWVQGRWRNPSSNAAKDRQHVQIRQVEKALRHEAHGMNIYAYNHIRTHQVVYSLTRVLNNTKVMRQLVYHGKKTVPESLRRDMWRPYFSIHFPQTLAGSQAGLQAFQQLRELALTRQLAPPEELLLTRQEDIDRYRKTKGDPVDTRSLIDQHKLKLPNLNQKLPKKLRARRLMDQKATSVADAAFVLGRANDGLTPEERLVEIDRNRVEQHKLRSQRARRRMKLIREKEEAKQKQLEQKANLNATILTLDKYAATRVSMEYQGVINDLNQVKHLEVIEQATAATETVMSQNEKLNALRARDGQLQQLLRRTESEIRKEWEQEHKNKDPMPVLPPKTIEKALADARLKFDKESLGMQTELDQSSREVQVLWADMRDGTYAESWPENVFHGELESMAMAKKSISFIMQEATVDEEGHEIAEQRQTKNVPASSSIHVIGSELGAGWVPDQIELEEQESQRRIRAKEQFADAQAKLDEIEKRVVTIVTEKEEARSQMKELMAKKKMVDKTNMPGEMEDVKKSIRETNQLLQELQEEKKSLPSDYKFIMERGLVKTEQELEDMFGKEDQDQHGTGDAPQPKERTAEELKALKDAGIEVDDVGSRRGVWGRVRGFFGR